MPAFLKKSVPVQVVLGTQWGDEGKGKVVDLLGEDVDVVVRFQGGPNAGHTVEFDGETFILHLIPTGILRPDVECIIGNGVVINPDSILEEINNLESREIEVLDRLYISHNAHLILPYHCLLDKASENHGSTESIGTTGRGIGPAYADKSSRRGIRIADLLDEKSLKEKVQQNVLIHNVVLKEVYGLPGVKEQAVLESLLKFRDKCKDRFFDTASLLWRKMHEGKRILLEGAQGTLLDIDFGTYPYVTSSNTTIGGTLVGLGISPKRINRIIGILKAYTTRVGNGPFPTELSGDFGDKLREMGGEYGATTGRPRRCGWFDSVIARYAVQLNGIDALALTKLDVLDTLDEIKICTGYRYKGEKLDYFPTNVRVLNEIDPVFETWKGWKQSISDIRKYEDLPDPTKNYLKRIEEITQTPIGIISVGPKRKETVWK